MNLTLNDGLHKKPKHQLCVLPFPHIAGGDLRQITHFDYTIGTQSTVYTLDQLEDLCPQ
jgi:hypothetical protein